MGRSRSLKNELPIERGRPLDAEPAPSGLTPIAISKPVA
jgi:hypothetical protein